MNDIIQYFDIPEAFEAPLSAIGGSLIRPGSAEDLDGVKMMMFRVNEPRWSQHRETAAEEGFYRELAALHLSKELDAGVAFMGAFRT